MRLRHELYATRSKLMLSTKVVPSIEADLVQRFVFNFRVDPDWLRETLGCDWLEPQILDGAAVGSFCLLELTGISFGIVPSALGLSSTNCSYRYGVVDKATGEPAVFVEERCTDSKLGSWLTSLGFPGFHPLVSANVVSVGADWNLTVAGATQIEAVVNPNAPSKSKLFPGTDAFADFIANGKRSYCPAKDAHLLNVVDLHKSESVFQPVGCERWRSERFDFADFDSAYRTTGGRYEWRFVEQRER